jgi:hypothetical protein
MQLGALQTADTWDSCVTVITNISHFVSILMQLIKDVGDGQKQYGKSNLRSDFKIGTSTGAGDTNI